MTTRFEATVALNKEKCVHQDGENGIFIDSVKVVDFTEIDKKVIELKAEYDSQEYARNRKDEYDALNQLELMSDDSINGTTTHKDAIVAIKAKWPKDNSGPV